MSMLPKKSLNRITLVNILSTVLLQGIAMFTAPIISRMLGTNNYGIISIYNTWVPILTTVLSLQVGTTLNLSRVEYAEEEQKKYHSSILFLALLCFGAGTALIMCFVKPLSNLLGLHQWMFPLMLFHAYGSFCVSFLSGKLTYEFKSEKNLFLSLAVSVLTICLSIFLITKMPAVTNYWGRVLGMSSVYGIFGIVITVFFLKTGKVFYNASYWKFCLPLAIPMIVHTLSGVILGQCDRIMLQQMCDASSVGIYSLAAAFASITTIIWNALNSSWSPFFYEYSKNNQIDQIKLHGLNFMELFTVLTIGFMLLTPEVFHIFASKEYWSGTHIIPVLVLGTYFVFMYAFPANYEFFNKKTKATATCTVIAGVCNIILNVFFIRWWGIFGAALATMVAHGLQFLIHHFYAMSIKKGVDYPFHLRVMLPFLAVVLAVTAWVTFAPGVWWLRWGIGALLGIWELYRLFKRKTIF